MESIQNSNNHPIDLFEFFDHYGCTLPRTVKLVDGFCGTNDDDTLEADQVFVLYKVERQSIIMALDEFRQEICIQQNSNTKVNLLPLECQGYSTVQELITAQSRFVLVLADIPATGIESGSKLRVLSDQNGVPNYLKCQVVHDHDDPKDVLLPLHLTGKFLPLLDTEEYYLDELLAQNELPINVRFVSQRRGVNDRLSTYSLTSLGNICLMRRTEEEMVFAASFENELLLYLFPKTLDISVGWGFQISAETSKMIKECRKIFETSETSLKRLDHEIKGSYYFMTSPVRRFKLQSLCKMAPLPLPRFPRAKRRQTPEEKLPINRKDSTKRAFDRVSSASNNSCFSVLPCHGEIKDDGDYENYETVEMPATNSNIITTEMGNTCSAVSEIPNDVIYSNVITATKEPVPPPKTRSSPSGERSDKIAKPQSSSPPLPKPRIRLKGVEMAGSDECASPMAEIHSRSGIAFEYPECAHSPPASSEDDVDECCPELPPRPIFLQQLLYINDGENEMPLSQEDSPPALPPRNSVKYGEKARPKQHHIENEDDKKPSSRGETAPPPPLPPRNRSMAYFADDVTDWENVEDNYGAYTPVKDDWRFFTQDGDRNPYIDVIFEPDETDDYLVTKDQLTEENERLCPDKPCKDRKMLRLREAEVVQQDKGNGSKDDDELYEELNNLQVTKTAEKQNKPGMKRPSRNCSGIHRSRSTQCSAETRETIVRMRLRQACMKSEVAQQLQKESRKDGDPYEEVRDSQIEISWKNSVSQTKLEMRKPSKQCSMSTTKGSTEKRQIENMDNFSLREVGTEGKEAQKDKEEMDSSLLESKFRGATKADNEKKQGVKKWSKNDSNVNSKNCSSRECSVQKSREEGVIESSSRNKKKIWISARRDEDCMDFKDIGQFFKLKKELSAAHAQVDDLKKQVAVKEKSPTERLQQMIDNRTSITSYASSTNFRNTQSVGNDLKEEKLNVLDTTKAICKQSKGNIQNGTDFRHGSGKNMENTEKTVPGREELLVHEHDMNKTNDSETYNYDDDFYEKPISVENRLAYHGSDVKNPNNSETYHDDYDFYEKPISVEKRLAYHGSDVKNPNNSETYHDDDDFYEKPISVENRLAYHVSDVKNPNNSETYHDDDDFYEKPISVENESAFHMDVGKEKQSNGDSAEDKIEPTYYNSVDIETVTDESSLYLQLLNPSDEDEDIYVNIDGQDSYDVKQKLNETKEVTNNVSTYEEQNLRNHTPFLGNSIFHIDPTKCSGRKECSITKEPPLPPGKCTS